MSTRPEPSVRAANVPSRRRVATLARSAGGPAPASAAGPSTAPDLLHEHLRPERLLPGPALVAGNQATALVDGPDTYAAMLRAIAGAQDHVNLETYILSDDAAGQRFADALLACQARGVQVNLVYDSVGSLSTPRAFFDRLREGAVNVLEFNPVNPLDAGRRPWAVNARDHRKLMIVDGHTAFLGGINIDACYLPQSPGSVPAGGADETGGWRDTHMQLAGPAVAQFQRLFLETWARQGGPPLPERDYFPVLERCGQETVRALATTAAEPSSRIHDAVRSAIDAARSRVWISNAYFVPDAVLRLTLCAAARRGVDVRLLLPGHTDSKLVFHAGRSRYRGLLAAGVRVFERRGPVLHCKTATVDGVWSTVGSANLDARSELHNDEVNAVVLGVEFAARMEAIFEDDLTQAHEWTRAHWRRRPAHWRGLETGARLLERWL